MKMRGTLKKTILFILIFAAIFTLLTDILKDKRFSQPFDVANKVTGFYHEPKDSLDFIFFGSSQLYYSINPIVLWRDYGITSYDFAANEQPLWISYYYIKEAMKYQKPKAVLLDVRYVYFEDEFQREGVNRINFDDIRFSWNKIEMINASVPKDERASYYVDMIKYHSNWKNLDASHFEYLYYYKDNPYKGYSFNPNLLVYPPELDGVFSQETEKLPIPERSLEYLNKIISYAKENGIDLILIKTPDANPDGQLYYNSVADVARERDVPFINMNTIMPGAPHPDFIKAEEVTDYFGRYLKAHYELTDHRQDPAYAGQWDEDLTYYNQLKSEAYLSYHPLVFDYLQLLDNSNYITVVALDGEVPAIDDTTALQLKVLGWAKICAPSRAKATLRS